MKGFTRSRALWSCFALATSMLASCFSSGLKLYNETTSLLVPYPVVTTPPPPHRQADPSGEVPPGGNTSLDPAGFNPLFHAEGVSNPQAPNALYLGFDLHSSDPAQILVRVMHYPGIPGQEGNDPSLQPIVLHETLVDVPDVDHEIRVIEAPSDTPGLPWWNVNVSAIP